MAAAKDVTFTLKVMVNESKTKVLFAEANSDFVDVLLSFLTMPLGKIVQILKKHFGDEAPVIGSLNTLYNGIDELDSVHFWTKGCKQMLLNPRSSFEAECQRLKVDITDADSPEFLVCGYGSHKLPVTSIYCDTALCKRHGVTMKRQRWLKISQAARDGSFLTKNTAAFIISDDLHIMSCATELVHIISILGITNTDGAELINVTFGYSEILDLLKVSLFSPTPLSEVILSQKRVKRQRIVESEAGSSSSYQIEMDTIISNSKKMVLKVIVQTSTNKLLYARAEEDFVDFLSSFLTIPLGGIVPLLGSNNSLKSINNIYKSIVDLIDRKFFETLDMKNRLIKMKLPHGSISENQILPLTQESFYGPPQLVSSISSVNFPEGQGKYVKGPRTFLVADDLTVTPFCMSSIISMLNLYEIPLSDIKEVELQIGLHEALNILRMALSSTCVLTDALKIYSISSQRPRR